MHLTRKEGFSWHKQQQEQQQCTHACMCEKNELYKALEKAAIRLWASRARDSKKEKKPRKVHFLKTFFLISLDAATLLDVFVMLAVDGRWGSIEKCIFSRITCFENVQKGLFLLRAPWWKLIAMPMLRHRNTKPSWVISIIEYVISGKACMCNYNPSPLFSAPSESPMQFSFFSEAATKNMRNERRDAHTQSFVWVGNYFSAADASEQCNRKFFIRQIHFFNDHFPWQHVPHLPSEIFYFFVAFRRVCLQKDDKRRTGREKKYHAIYY